MQFFPENPSSGYVKIKFSSALHADECVKMMEGRFFDGRRLKAYYWDGKTDYRIVRETADELNKRIDDFGQWLE
jgi:HIV Tat-specific factor 1